MDGVPINKPIRTVFKCIRISQFSRVNPLQSDIFVCRVGSFIFDPPSSEIIFPLKITCPSVFLCKFGGHVRECRAIDIVCISAARAFKFSTVHRGLVMSLNGIFFRVEETLLVSSFQCRDWKAFRNDFFDVTFNITTDEARNKSHQQSGSSNDFRRMTYNIFEIAPFSHHSLHFFSNHKGAQMS